MRAVNKAWNCAQSEIPLSRVCFVLFRFRTGGRDESKSFISSHSRRHRRRRRVHSLRDIYDDQTRILPSASSGDSRVRFNWPNDEKPRFLCQHCCACVLGGAGNKSFRIK